MRELTARDVHRIFDEFDTSTISGSFGVTKSPSGRYFIWVEKVIKLDEMPERTAQLFSDLMSVTGAHKIEAICSEKTGSPDRLKVTVTP